MTHQTELIETYPTGAQRWGCPTCGRSVMWQWSPRIKSIVLFTGDETVSHAGGMAVEVDIVTPDEQAAVDQWRKEFDDNV